jgi:hypothetical protein
VAVNTRIHAAAIAVPWLLEHFQMHLSNINNMQWNIKHFYRSLRIVRAKERGGKGHGFNANILFAEYTDCQYAVKTAGQKANAG